MKHVIAFHVESSNFCYRFNYHISVVSTKRATSNVLWIDWSSNSSTITKLQSHETHEECAEENRITLFMFTCPAISFVQFPFVVDSSLISRTMQNETNVFCALSFECCNSVRRALHVSRTCHNFHLHNSLQYVQKEMIWFCVCMCTTRITTRTGSFPFSAWKLLFLVRTAHVACLILFAEPLNSHRNAQSRRCASKLSTLTNNSNPRCSFWTVDVVEYSLTSF